ncbi:hypothetical protein CVS40_6563 [Lucilia cuprina]|nr:hypothetical protein CVS40_6563 [Lucilia cuprina]
MLNYQRVKNDCIVNGIECKDTSKAAESFVQMMNTVGVTVNANEIDNAHFLKNKNCNNKSSRKQSLVVKFNNNQSKQKVMSSKVALKENDKTKDVYINDFLSKETLMLLNHAKSLKKSWLSKSFHGKVYTKRSELSPPKLIRNAEEVDNLLFAATTNRRSSRQDKDNLDESEDEPHSPFMSPP